jgi:cell division protease FtsH
MGGRVAEELFLRQMTSGASNDIERATELARKMVCELGMSPLGPVHFRRPSARGTPTPCAGFSEETARRVDEKSGAGDARLRDVAPDRGAAAAGREGAG